MADKDNKDMKKDKNGISDKKDMKTAAEEKAESACECDECAECAAQSEDEAAKLQKDLDEAKDMLLRTAAEFDNYKKRSERERAQVGAFVKAQTIKAILPAVDNLQRAVASDSGSEDYIKGVDMTIRQLLDALANMGLTEIDPENDPFDPNLHEAVMHEENADLPENTVTQVLQKGYKVDDTVIRPAMVKVAN